MKETSTEALLAIERVEQALAEKAWAVHEANEWLNDWRRRNGLPPLSTEPAKSNGDS